MNIGQAAKATGISAKMIRYYEDSGLIGPVARTASGYRVYGPRDIHTLGFIKRSRDMGFSVERIGGLLQLWRDRSRHSADVKRMALEHVAVLQQRIAELQDMVATVQTLADCCAGDERPDCPILSDIATGAPLHSPGGGKRLAKGSRGRARACQKTPE
ncbi:MAG: Cu(I)-responsive transcriptional regulator [Stenotrophomonas nitritireducens]|uniref:Cu(I)-responsive transcriptional regulator n=1 Tax=Stenotrophomonas nitritireducens TaxID=83617 RepID=UPI001AC0A0AF|nr:Cu(I)-responsive transcriptional regulator [Stenotrophomonas nitritireducens]MBN8791591.1 Cu(I)-responsive transcriptional regulator [Stenotrophomonas nitritireducens]MBN8795529.1 Cu(I)-responsive transcriptional regulator [Stenotrophomonas nitritireducens]